MKFKNTVFILLLLLVAASQWTHATKAPLKITSNTEIQNAILVHINEYRKSHGMSPLIMDNRIVKEAIGHSMDMAQHKMPFGHQYFMKRIDRLHHQIKNSGAAAENVAYNYKDAEDVVKNWIRSPGHKRNIDGNYNLTGIGIARDSHGKIYFTQIFLKHGNPVRVTHRPLFNLFNRSLLRRNA